jgi:hypothetical protein
MPSLQRGVSIIIQFSASAHAWMTEFQFHKGMTFVNTLVTKRDKIRPDWISK